MTPENYIIIGSVLLSLGIILLGFLIIYIFLVNEKFLSPDFGIFSFVIIFLIIGAGCALLAIGITRKKNNKK